MGRSRRRRRWRSRMTIAPRRRAASIDGRALTINPTWYSARLTEAARNRITEGELASRRASHLNPATLRRLPYLDLGRHALGEQRQVRHDPDQTVVGLQGLDGLYHRLQGLLGVEGAEALVDEQALQRLVAVGAGGQVGQALGEGQRQGERRQERFPTAEGLDRADGVPVPGVDNFEVQVLGREPVAAV